MREPQPGTICYMLLAPFERPLEGRPTHAGPFDREAPHFFDLDIDYEILDRRELRVEDVRAVVTSQLLDGVVWVAECRFNLPDILDSGLAQKKHRLTRSLRERLLADLEVDDPLVEEYTILLLRKPAPVPDSFVDDHPNALVRLLRRVDKPLEQADALAILSNRARYSQGDLTAVDWEGAVVIAEAGDYDSDIELLKVGNYQLLRYRMLDRRIELGLNELRQSVSEGGRALFPRRRIDPPEIIEQRLSLLLDFDKIDQSLLLIGDWYTARLYRLVVDAFYLESWRQLVKAKLESLATIEESVQSRLAVTWGRVFDTAQLVGWMVLLIGYVILFVLEL